MRAVAYCKGTVFRDGDGIRHPRSLVVAFASRELMALDPGDRKVCSSHSSSADDRNIGDAGNNGDDSNMLE
jgi:hypothetical protein